ncbi:MAG TPA: DUF4783 domain-containing protein [Candidatus Eisenbacteria bacterium]|uniref:DUF4783 domain-containing protein n=1 Tax=Eiseniibacteriota bacterium TaxID=2212470 RepID=A0A7V2AW68_UNCEI|nr:DUF4783 domain-containing protein [Candidatus Eisenbacteria bacterium]
MRRRYTILLLFLAALVLAGGAAHAGQDRRKKPKEPKEPVPTIAMDPMIVFRGIEAAWRAGDARKLAAYAGDSKVLLNVRGLGEKGGYYSRSQVFYLFKGMFESTRHKKFDFVGFHEVGEKSSRIYGIARRNYEIVSNGRLFQDKIYVTLKQEGKRWVVSEMKSAW